VSFHRSLSTHGRSLIGSAVRWIGSEDPFKPGRRGSRRLRPIVWALEERLLLSSGSLDLTWAAGPPAIPGQTALLHTLPTIFDDPPDPAVPLPATAPTGTTTPPSTTGVKHPLSDRPALSSLPGAPASLYLDFTGDYTSSYGTYSNIATPAFDQDGDPTTFSDSELAAIQKIWSYVAEDYAPFNLNVTTVAPASMAHGATEKADIGGNGSWTGGSYGGYTYVNDFTLSVVPNIAFVFSQNLAGGNTKYTADAITHESGHGFGLVHQSSYSGATKTAEYSTGPGDGTAPLMGNSYAARRSLWWYGPSDVSSTTYQDDMAVIAGPTNKFGYRPEPGDSTAATATPLALQTDTQVSGAGLIIKTSDLDFYSFTSGPGAVSFTVSVPADISNLAPKVELLDASGSTVIAAAGPSATDFSASLTATLPVAGSYRLLVTSNGGYGNVGHYTISGTITTPSNPPGGTGTGTGTQPGPVALNPPANLTASASSPYRIDLAWSDVAGEIGFRVDRTTDGVNWITVGTTTTGIAAFADVTVTPGTTYAYRVVAVGAGGNSAVSAAALATTPFVPAPPAAVSNVNVVVRAPRQIVLGWQPSPVNAQGYIIERSTNGRTWTAIGKVSAGSTSFADGSVAPLKTYFYRVRAFNPWGSSAASRVTRVTTPRAPSPKVIRKKAR
jgi:hypothetical protein